MQHTQRGGLVGGKQVVVASLSSLQQGSKQAAAVRGQTGSLPHLGQRPEPQTFSQHLKQTLVSAALPIKLRQAKYFHKEMNKMENIHTQHTNTYERETDRQTGQQVREPHSSPRRSPRAMPH